MDRSDNPPRWFGRRRGDVVGSPVADDPADLGTCFGLDLSLSDRVADAVGEPGPMDGDAGWMNRLLSRRGGNG